MFIHFILVLFLDGGNSVLSGETNHSSSDVAHSYHVRLSDTKILELPKLFDPFFHPKKPPLVIKFDESDTNEDVTKSTDSEIKVETNMSYDVTTATKSIEDLDIDEEMLDIEGNDEGLSTAYTLHSFNSHISYDHQQITIYKQTAESYVEETPTSRPIIMYREMHPTKSPIQHMDDSYDSQNFYNQHRPTHFVTKMPMTTMIVTIINMFLIISSMILCFRNIFAFSTNNNDDEEQLLNYNV